MSTAAWTAQQIREAFPGDGTEPRYLLRDRDGVYGDTFRLVVRAIGIREILTAPGLISVWMGTRLNRDVSSRRAVDLSSPCQFWVGSTTAIVGPPDLDPPTPRDPTRPRSEDCVLACPVCDT